MKKSFKILSFLAVAVVAFIISFTIIQVNGATSFNYTDDNVSIDQPESEVLLITINNATTTNINTAMSYFKFETLEETEKTIYLDIGVLTQVSENVSIEITLNDNDAFGANELLEYKIYNSLDELIVEYPISEEGGETMSGFITQIFETLGDIISGFANLLVSLFENVVKIFYTAPTGGETIGSLTVVGVLTLVAMGCGLVIWGFKFLRSLIRVKTK